MSNKPITSCPVNSHNEWDPLEEVIIGNLNGATFPAWNNINNVTIEPEKLQRVFNQFCKAGSPYPLEIIEAAQKDLDNFIHILKNEGVTVRITEHSNFSASFKTPNWEVRTGFSSASPRDPFLVIGNEIIETPMADRGRFFEAWPYRKIFKEYFKKGARWSAAPKPQLLDELYEQDFPKKNASQHFIINEFEPVFDAADFVRCGRDIFCHKSHVTNSFGIEWLQRHLGEKYRIHCLESLSPKAIHIDTTFMPLAPGKVLVNPEFLNLKKLPKILNRWDILEMPTPLPENKRDPFNLMSSWIGINLLMLDEERVVVESNQELLIKALKNWGFKPIPCSFEAYYPFLGSLHCATLDIRRRGILRSYF